MNEKQALSSHKIQAKLASLQQAAGHQGADTSGHADIEITVASQRDAFDLKACLALLEENGISSKFVGRGFNQVVVVSRKDSSRAFDVIAANREQLLRTNALTAGDYVVGIVAWSLGWGMGLSSLCTGLMFKFGASPAIMMVAFPVLLVGSTLLGGFLGYFRCRAIASRRR